MLFGTLFGVSPNYFHQNGAHLNYNTQTSRWDSSGEGSPIRVEVYGVHEGVIYLLSVWLLKIIHSRNYGKEQRVALFKTVLSASILSICSLVFAMGSSKPRPAPPPAQPAPAPSPPPKNPAGGASLVTQIQTLAESSDCGKYSWKNRTVAPAGYISGMSLAFAKSLCRLRSGENKALVMAQKASLNSSIDALTWYEEKLSALKMDISHSGADTLRSVYTLGIGLGMRESSGKYCEGFDASAGPETASEAEAGMFQFSYNSIGASPELRNLYDEYRGKSAQCYLSTFAKGVSCRTQAIVGSGAGADFQVFTKSCPAFAAEYAMLSLRVLRKHYGPINRQEAEVLTSCNQLLDAVQMLIEQNSADVCSEI